MLPEIPELKTERLLLRRITDADLPDIYRGLSHPDVIRYYGVSYSSPEATRAQMDFYRNLEKEGTGAWWVICDLESGVFMGAAGFNHYQPQHRKVELGYWLLPGYQRRGFAAEAIRLLCAHVFSQSPVHRIEAWVEKGNTASGQLLRKLGFRHEGTLEDAEIKHNRFISLEVYALLSAASLPSPA